LPWQLSRFSRFLLSFLPRLLHTFFGLFNLARWLVLILSLDRCCRHPSQSFSPRKRSARKIKIHLSNFFGADIKRDRVGNFPLFFLYIYKYFFLYSARGRWQLEMPGISSDFVTFFGAKIRPQTIELVEE